MNNQASAQIGQPMNNYHIKEQIRSALKEIRTGDFAEKARTFLQTLHYESERVLPEQSDNVDDFLSSFPAPKADTATEHIFREEAKGVSIIGQMMDEDIIRSARTQNMLFDDDHSFDKGNHKSFLLVAVELKREPYTRSQYAQFTREINKRLPMPAIVLFKAAEGRFTLAFVYRRIHKLDKSLDVLGNVALIRDIDTQNPHRAHLDILAELALKSRLQWISQKGKQPNFDSLLDAWLEALDTEELNRKFYKELFAWFERAVREAKFPSNEIVTLLPEQHVMRLITRLMFVWFLKEKGLIAEELFSEPQIKALLKKYDRDKGDSYYRTVLQNLFFATLNTEISKRGFSKENNATHRNFSYYRYENEMDASDALLALFRKTPFINGGLFDCLDSETATCDGGYRIDCFSDNENHSSLLSIPNRLFFDSEGLIPLFNRYKFTVEENTPAEQDVALDPELLGKVFENLLAAYNPEHIEIRKTVRKQTGSYYTPRPVVDYMVDETLTASMMEKTQPDDGDKDYWNARLRYLLNYAAAFDDAEELFSEEERNCIVQTIAKIKVLDPAVGSGAFPMGILHKLTLALRRLDPHNKAWEALQKELAIQRADAAFEKDNQQERDAELAEISATFQRYRDSDFGRKLYLIQNSIFGVDIQPIACQIAKLRFFISLAIEQIPTDNSKKNYDIKPLPNLETRFVAANTLLALQISSRDGVLGSDSTRNLQRRLRLNREQHFHATTRHIKLKCQKNDAKLRKELITILKDSLSETVADKIAYWNPYDQNAKADWFDAEYMFGVRNGFDIVIGNPPYRQVRKGIYPAIQFPYSEKKDKGKQNLYKLFVEKSHNLTKEGGIASLIVQSSLMCDFSSAATRQLLLKHTQLKHIIEFPARAKSREAQVFTTVQQGTCIYQFTKADSNNESINISVGNDTHTIVDLHFTPITKDTILTLYPKLYCIPHIRKGNVSILEKIAYNKDIKPLQHYAKNIIQGDLNLSTHSAKFSNKLSPVRLLRGRHVSRFIVKYDDATEYCENNFLIDKIEENKRNIFLISQEVTFTSETRRLNFALTEYPSIDFLWGHSVNKTLLKKAENSKSYLALLNSKFMDWFFRITSTNNHVQGYELEQLPIPVISDANRKRLEHLIDGILSAKAADPSVNTDTQEAEIDRLIYKLYGLNEEEIATVEEQAGSY